MTTATTEPAQCPEGDTQEETEEHPVLLHLPEGAAIHHQVVDARLSLVEGNQVERPKGVHHRPPSLVKLGVNT